MLKPKKPKKTPVFGKERKVSVQARYVAMLAPFMSTEDTRYYLNGIYIAPHPSGGVVMVATDGHRMGVVFDKDGRTRKRWICAVSKTLIQKCGDQKRLLLPGKVHFIGESVYVVDELYKGKDPGQIGAHHLLSEYAPPIDGTYPDWTKVVPKDGLPKRATCANFNPDYLIAYRTVLKHGGHPGGPVTIFPADATQPVFVLVAGVPEFVGVQMPMRGAEEPKLPGWLLKCLPEPEPEKMEIKVKKPAARKPAARPPRKRAA